MERTINISIKMTLNAKEIPVKLDSTIKRAMDTAQRLCVEAAEHDCVKEIENQISDTLAN